MNATQLLRGLATVVVAGLLAGCGGGGGEMTPPGESFGPNDSSRPVWQSMDRQAALGAREGATLYASDFDGAQLNGLGRAHLDAMMADKQGPAVVYVDVNPQDAASAAQRDAVTQYMQQMEGAGETRVEFGANWAVKARASDNISRLPKTESPRRASGSRTSGGTGTSSGNGTSDSGSQSSESMNFGGTNK